jgi:hypothetical protein
MAKLNLFLHLNGYADTTPSNNPNLNLFKWSRDLQSLSVAKAKSEQLCLAPGESRSLFNGTRTLLQDNTTEYELSLKPASSNTYVLKHVGGTAPQFRTLRSTGTDATTEVSVTKNGNVLTFESTGGTPFDLITGGAVVGDEVKIGAGFAVSNQGTFKLLSRTAVSFSVENPSGAAEGPITLGVDFENVIRIFSSSGVQVKDTLVISAGFSPVSQNSYEITAVTDSEIEFYSTYSLPEETVVTDDITVYSQAKKLIYIESDGKAAILVNGAAQGKIEPIISNGEAKPGMLLKTETVWSLQITNDSINTVNLFFASVE